MEIEICKMIYLIDEDNDNSIRILGEEFSKNNRNKAKIIIRNRKRRLKHILLTNELEGIDEGELKVKMVLSRNIYNKSYMFKDCDLLLQYSIDEQKSIKDFENQKNREQINEDFSTENIENFDLDYFDDNEESNLYKNCNFPSTIKKVEENILDNSLILFYTKNLTLLNNNYTILNGMFQGCSSLLSLPGIEEWNTYNVIDISSMFNDCSSLYSLPDISKWNTENVIDMSNLFSFCSGVSSLPDISKWKTNNLINMKGMFYNCSSLLVLPDISKWNTNKVTDMSELFYNCSLLAFLPNLSKWNTENLINMKKLFYNCSSLLSLPDLS